MPRLGQGGESQVKAGFDIARVQQPIAIRSRRNGDRLLPSGSTAEKKVKALLIDAGVPRRLRPGVPILVDGVGGAEERILWVVGVRRSAHAPVGEMTGEFLEVQLSAPQK